MVRKKVGTSNRNSKGEFFPDTFCMPYLIIHHVLIPCYPLSLKVANVISNVNNVICLPF